MISWTWAVVSIYGRRLVDLEINNNISQIDDRLFSRMIFTEKPGPFTMTSCPLLMWTALWSSIISLLSSPWWPWPAMLPPSCWSNSLMWTLWTQLKDPGSWQRHWLTTFHYLKDFKSSALTVNVNQMIEPGDLMSFVRFLVCHPTQHLVNFFHGWTHPDPAARQDTEQARQYSMELFHR